ncbi:MAG: glycosyltransferase [Verrucomicrobiota bacterium]
MNIWLAYVSYPITTAVYLEKAFRKNHSVTTLGPQVTPEQLSQWGMSDLSLPISSQDIPTDYEPDLQALIQKESTPPDLFLWIESVHGFYPKNIDKLSCPSACYLIDSHLNFEWQKLWAKNFDFVFIAQQEYIDHFQAAGIQHVHWLPLGCDPEVHSVAPRSKIHQISFVGSPHKGFPRERFLQQISIQFPLFQTRAYLQEMASIFAESKIVFNKCVRNDLNMRVFETLASGSLLLTDDPGIASGQSELFVAGEDLVVYNEETLIPLIEYYLKNDSDRETIAQSGKIKALQAHAYAHRVEAMLEVIQRRTVTTPDGSQWRDRSLGKPDSYFLSENPWRGAILPSRPQRSFVIPVLDQSPASPYNISTLLHDLESIDGNVIVVFNSEKMAATFAKHPRVNLAVTLSQNVGVARAWNIGVHLSETPTVFILNADLHLRPKSIPVIERTLQRIEKAAVAGPQGSFFNFHASIDYQYFDQGALPRPLQVDAISGFFFAIKREHFVTNTLRFEDDYSPCYFEEWDLGLQCREKGLECWIAPTTDYDHEWSGTIKANKNVPYFDRRESIFDIHARNTKRFQQKWLERSKKLSNPQLLLSRYPTYLLNLAQEFEKQGNQKEAENLRQKALSLIDHFDRCLK